MIKTYYHLTKPGIIYGNVLVAAGGFFLASRGVIDPILLIATLLGLGLVIASGCVFNNYIDRNIDRIMSRTQNRAIPRGLVSKKTALLYGSILWGVGILVLVLYVNVLAASIALLGHFVYVLVYGFAKRKTPQGTEVGSLAGAVPPVVGYCAVTNRIDVVAFVLFLILVVWQMPHFYALAIGKLEDYKAASIPVLPVVRGIVFTKFAILAYIAVLTVVSSLLTMVGQTGYTYLFGIIGVGIAWFVTGVRMFRKMEEKVWAWRMFRFSLIFLVVFSILISFDVVLP